MNKLRPALDVIRRWPAASSSYRCGISPPRVRAGRQVSDPDEPLYVLGASLVVLVPQAPPNLTMKDETANLSDDDSWPRSKDLSPWRPDEEPSIINIGCGSMMPQPDTHRKEDEMSDPATAHDTISTAQLAATVELACRAPSLHNSQPWRWIFENGTLHLFADHARVGRHTDATGREVILSCGAALDHLQVAAATAGWQVTVERYPNPHDHDHLASVVFHPGRVRGRARARVRRSDLEPAHGSVGVRGTSAVG